MLFVMEHANITRTLTERYSLNFLDINLSRTILDFLGKKYKEKVV